MHVSTITGDTCSYCHSFTGDSGFSINAACTANYATDYDSVSNTFTITVDSVTTAIATSYDWDFGDGSTSTLATPTHAYAIDSLYNVCMKVHYTGGDSCTYCHIIGIDSVGNIIRDGGFSLTVHNATTGISENAIQPVGFTIYPNPTTGIFQLTIDNGQLLPEGELSIYNMIGEKIYARDIKQLVNVTAIDLSAQSNGIYFMQLKTNNNTITKKIIISK